MTIERFRSIEEVPPPGPRQPDGRGLRRAVALSVTSLRLARRKSKHGVFRFASIEQAKADKLR